jgi:2-oxoglutarate dehydrogenase E2 component (dihydrolipoamide succinyltransferase)
MEIKVPPMGESVAVATVAKWLKKTGDLVKVDEAILVLDSDKASVEVVAPVAGVLKLKALAAGTEVKIGEVIGEVVAGSPVEKSTEKADRPEPGPAARRALQDAGLSAEHVQGSGKGGRVTSLDVKAAESRPEPIKATESRPEPVKAAEPVKMAAPIVSEGDEPVDVVPMSSIRRKIAERLIEAQSTAAILTTFNEVDMSRIMALRERYQERFQKKYGIKLGFMSFFVKAAIEALKAWPSANAELRGTDIIYKHYYHIGVAVSGARGLVVPVLRHADRLSFAETELAIAKFGEKAKNNQISVDELKGGTFTISNGGIFGSMMSTPILNPPQVAILGMHNIQKRAVVVTEGGEDTIVIRPMMYLAVSYDHRLLDGREAVSFLVRIKECVEDPERILLEI